VLGRSSTIVPGGPDPEKTDRVMLRRNRLSRIFFNSRFFDYPVSLKMETLRNMGFGTTVAVGFSYLKTVFHKREEKSLEDFYINRFGKSCIPCSSRTIPRTCGDGIRARFRRNGAPSG
jgi:hypothetical protein